MESHDKKSKVFRENYGSLKSCFNCCKEEAAAMLYSKGLVSAEVRDSRDTNTMLAALERVVAVREEAWDVLITEVMVDPPLLYLAPKMTKELEEEKLASERRWSRESTPSCRSSFSADSSNNGFHSDSNSSGAAGPHPTTLSFNSETASKYPAIDSGNWSSDKYLFPSGYFNLTDPSIPSTINEHDPTTNATDSGIIKDDGNTTRELVDDTNEATPIAPLRGGSDEPQVPQVVQSVNETTRSEMVNPVGDVLSRNNTPISGATPTTASDSTAVNSTLRDLRIEVATLKQKLLNSREECDGLKTEIDIVNDRRIEDSKLLERKLKQLSDDNQLLGKQCAERRELELENRRLVKELKRCKNIIEECESDIIKLKTCLKIAERNAWVQSVTIDKLRAKVAEQETAFTEYKNTQLKDSMYATVSSHNTDSSPPSYY